MQPLISRDGHISSFGPGNMLMIVDSSTNIEKLLKIIESIDKPGMEEPELVLLKYANAEDVVKIITEAARFRQQGPAFGGACAEAGRDGNAQRLLRRQRGIFLRTHD